MALTSEKLASLAPDAAALDAARKLLKPANWPMRAASGDGRLMWAECQGSGSTPYRVAADLTDFGTKCTCPSRKFPCKHALALLWQAIDGDGRFAVAEPPDWVKDWLARRRGARSGAGSPSAGQPGTAASIGPAARATEPAPAGSPPKAEAGAQARAAAQRDRLHAAREAAIRAGLDDLERWLRDRLDAGLAGFAGVMHEQCGIAARRLVDAKAPGLAALVGEIPGIVLALPDNARAACLIDLFGRLHLLSAAYRRQDLLPAPLRADVRRCVGWTIERAALLDDPDTLRVTATWRVAGIATVIQPDELRRIETWLIAAVETVPSAGQPSFALLLDFVPVSRGTVGAPFAVGEIFDGTLAFYPSAAPLRAVVAERVAGPAPSQAGPCGASSLADALDAVDRVRAKLPFIDCWPIAIGQGRIEDCIGGLMLTDTAGDVALPLPARQQIAAVPLLGEPIAAAGLWNGRYLTLLSATGPHGLWQDG